MSVSFASELWDQFEEVYRKVAGGKEFTTGIADFVHKRVALEREYSKKLQALCKATDKEIGTTFTAWTSIKDETENISKKHAELAESFTFQVEEPLQSFLRDTKKSRTALYEQGKKITKDVQSAESKANTAKISFEQARKKQDEAKDEVEKATMNNQPSPAIEKLNKKLKLETKKAVSADRKYSEAVDTCRALQDKFYDEEMPRILEEFESMEKNRLERTKICFQAYVELQTGVAPEIVSSCDRMRINITNISSATDLQQFINEKRTRAARPERIVYEPYNSDLGRCFKADAGAVQASTPSAVAPANPGISSPQNVRTVASGTPKGGALRGVSKCRGLFDYEATDPNELSFRQGDIITVLQKDPSGWWQGELNGRIGVFPSVEWVEEIAEAAAAPPSSSPQFRKCRALYDYKAENEFELSIYAGDVITVEGDEDGWYFGSNQRGNCGRYPSNFVEMI